MVQILTNTKKSKRLIIISFGLSYLLHTKNIQYEHNYSMLVVYLSTAVS